ncbi:hypothetical protein V8E54_003950 [Elaphomyces granulatus]
MVIRLSATGYDNPHNNYSSTSFKIFHRLQIKVSIAKMGLPIGLPFDTYRKIHKGLKACEEYVHDCEGAPSKTFETMAEFVMEYSQRANSVLQEFPFDLKASRTTVIILPSSLKDSGATFVLANTGIQIQWIEIARALKRRKKSLLPAHLWEGLSIVDENVTPGEAYVDSLLADSFIKAAKAISAGSVWQVVKYAGRESQCRIQDPKRSFSLGPGTYSRAIRAIAVALVQRSWFLGASSGEPVFMRTQYRAREYPGPMQGKVVSPLQTQVLITPLPNDGSVICLCSIEFLLSASA